MDENVTQKSNFLFCLKSKPFYGSLMERTVLQCDIYFVFSSPWKFSSKAVLLRMQQPNQHIICSVLPWKHFVTGFPRWWKVCPDGHRWRCGRRRPFSGEGSPPGAAGAFESDFVAPKGASKNGGKRASAWNTISLFSQNNSTVAALICRDTSLLQIHCCSV